jgi:hypothetical protein
MPEGVSWVRAAHYPQPKEISMKPNVGGIDRTVRIVAGVAILSLFFILEGNARWWGLVGLVPIFTGLTRWCPAYLPFGISTCPAEDKKG